MINTMWISISVACLASAARNTAACAAASCSAPNAIAGAALLGAVLLACRRETLALAWLAIGGVALCRPEGPIYALVLLWASYRHRLPRAQTLAGLGLFEDGHEVLAAMAHFHHRETAALPVENVQ